MENNTPAFPTTHQNNDGSIQFFDGMTLRDYFAAKAMQGVLSGMYAKGETDTPDKLMDKFELVSKNAYWFADQMLKQREQ